MVPSSEGAKSLEDGKNLFSELDIDTISLSARNGGEAKENIMIPFSVESIEDKAFSLSLHMDFSGKAPTSDFNIEVYCNNRFHKSKGINSTRLENLDGYWIKIIIPFDVLLDGNNVFELRLDFVSSNDGATTLILYNDSFLFVKTISYIQSTGDYSFSELGGALPYPAEYQDYLPDGSPNSQTIKATLEFKISEEVMTDQFSANLRAFYSVENYLSVYNISLTLFWNQVEISTGIWDINSESEIIELSTNVNQTLRYEGRNTLDIEINVFGNVSQYAIEILSNSTIMVLPFRDVTVTSLSVTPRVIKPGDWVVINTTIENLGSKDELVNIHLEIDDEQITTTKIKLLEGESIEKQFLWKAKNGRNEIIVSVEIDGLSPNREIDPENNELKLTLHIPTRDVTLSSVLITPKYPPVSGETIKVKIWIGNTGTVNETVTIDLYIDNTLVNTTKTNVPVNSYKEVTLEWSAIGGNHSILVKISGVENEENTADNSYSTTILVLEPLFSISFSGRIFLFDIIDIQFIYGAILILLTHTMYFLYYLRRSLFIEKHHRDIFLVIMGLTFPLLLFQAYTIRRTFNIPLLFEGLVICNLLMCNLLFIFGKRKWTTGSILDEKTKKKIFEYLKRKLGI